MGETTGANGTATPPTMRRNDVSMTDMSDVDTGDRLYHVRKSRLIRLINWWEVRNLLDGFDSITRSMPLPPCMICLVLATAMTSWIP